MDLDIDFEGHSNGNNQGSSAQGQQGNQGTQGSEHLDGHGDDNHGIEGKDSNGSNAGNQRGNQNQQGNQQSNQQNNQGQQGNQGEQNGFGFHPADQGNKGDKGNQGQQANPDSSSKGGLNPGDNLEIDDKKYTVDNKGNIVDDKGNIFKEAKDVADWLKSVNVDDSSEYDNKNGNDEKGLTVKGLQDAFGIEVNDKDGKPIEYSDNADGVKAYVNDVISLKSQELQQAAVNKIFADNPILKQFNDYITLNNGDPRGFGQIPDRSGISVDKDNENQQIAIIKMAAQEFGNKSINDNYINYLKQTGGLYDEARNQLNALQEKDKQVQQQIAQAAEEKRKQDDAAVDAYWQNVNDIINSRVIGSYKLPESFVKEVNGTKVTLTLNDFYDYLSKPVQDKDGNIATQYQRDLAALDPKVQLQKEMLSAWLTFTNSTPEDLAKLVINDNNVRVLRIKSKQARNSRTVRINTKPKDTDLNNLILN